MSPGSSAASRDGLLVWALGDEGVVPALGLSRGPRELPADVPAYGFASHVVFGIATEVVRATVTRALGGHRRSEHVL